MRENVGITFVITGLLLGGYPYVAVTGYITTPGFERGSLNVLDKNRNWRQSVRSIL